MDCPVEGESAPAFAAPVSGSMPPLGPTSDGGLPSGEADLGAVQPITDADVTGNTDLELKLRFTRLLVLDSMGMPADATLDVNPSIGTTTVPIACPAGACSGSVSLELGGYASGVDSEVRSASGKESKFPAPVTMAEPKLATASFKLKAGHTGVKVHLPTARAYLKVIAKQTFDVVVTERTGSKRESYVAGQAHLKLT